MKWYKRDPAAALEGMIGLSGEERGYYNTLLDLLYARAPNGHVTDELVVKAMGERPQVWRRVKARLIAKGKVRETDGKLSANRVETEVKLARNIIDNLAVLRARKQQKQQLSSLGSRSKTTTTTREEKKEAPYREPRKKADATPKLARSRTQFPDEPWRPASFTPADQPNFERFRNHAQDKGRLSANWEAAWSNWKESRYNAPPPNGGYSNGNGRAGSGLAANERLIEKLGGREAARRYEEQSRSAELDLGPGGSSVRRLPPRPVR